MYANLDKECFAEEIKLHIEDRQTVDFTEQKRRMAICEKRIGGTGDTDCLDL